AFNLNLLVRANRELGADFDVTASRHSAFCNAERERVEMHLVSLRDQPVHVAGHLFRFRARDTIHTYTSHKYMVEAFQEIARSAGFMPLHAWLDPQRLFSIHCLATEAASGEV